jgi:hypothetical protein
MSEVLEGRTREVDDSLRLVIHAGDGHRVVMRGERGVADDGDFTWARSARFAASVPPSAHTIAVIGGGLCVLPRLLRWASVTVYEIEPALRRFCPNGVVFVPGDWKNTLSGPYDVIVYDVGDTPDRSLLEQHLARGGVLLGVE